MSSNIEKLKYPPLSINGDKYLIWVTHTKAHLTAKGLNHTIQEQFTPIGQDQYKEAAQSIIFIRHHLTEDLQSNYLSTENPAILWKLLHDRFDNQRTIFMPQAIHDFNHIRFQDFATVSEYNTTLTDIVSRLEICGLEQMVTDKKLIDKTLSTFSPAHSTLSEIYWGMNFTKYTKLLTQLLMAEQRKTLILRNDKLRSSGSNIPPVGISSKVAPPTKSFESYLGETHYENESQKRIKESKPYRSNTQTKSLKKRPLKRAIHCFECGTNGHVAKQCRTSQHLRDLYKKSKKDWWEAKQKTTKDNYSQPKKSYNNINEKPEVGYTIIDNYMTNITIDKDIPNTETILLDSCSTHTILNDKKCFSSLKRVNNIKVQTIAGLSNSIGNMVGTANIQLPNGTQIQVKDAIFSPTARRNLLAFNDVRKSGLSIHMNAKSDNLELTQHGEHGNSIVETFYGKPNSLPSSEFSSPIAVIPNVSLTETIEGPERSLHQIWHARLGHPTNSTMRNLIKYGCLQDLTITTSDIQSNENCIGCIQGRFVPQGFKPILHRPIPAFLERINLDLCGPIDPPAGNNKYFMVIVDSSYRLLMVELLPTRNLAIPKLANFINKMKTQHPDNPIKSIRLDNAAEFTSSLFEEFCSSLGIQLEFTVPYQHAQNGIAEAHIKRIQGMVKPMLMNSNLPASAWGHAVIHSQNLLNLRPIGKSNITPLEQLQGYPPSVKHLRPFGCAVFVPIPVVSRTKLGPQRRIAAYIGFISPAIIKFLELTTGDMFTARFVDCIFNENSYPPLGGDKIDNNQRQLFFPNEWPTTKPIPEDPRTNQLNDEIYRILNLHSLMNTESNTINEIEKSMFKPAPPTPLGVSSPANESQPRKRPGRPFGSKTKKVKSISEGDDNPSENQDDAKKVVENFHFNTSLGNANMYLTRSEHTLTAPTTFLIAAIIDDEEESDPNSYQDAKNSSSWPKWEKAMREELESLIERKVFGPIQEAPDGYTQVGNRWVFVRKRNEVGTIIRYKARLVAQGFSQRPGYDFDNTYSPVMDIISYRYLIALAVHFEMQLQLMDVVAAYLYGTIDEEIYMQVPDGLKSLKTNNFKSPVVRILRSLYGLKQSGRCWYLCLKEFLIKIGFTTTTTCPCIFIQANNSGTCIIAVYVDDLNIIGKGNIIDETKYKLSHEFKMKDLGETKICIGIQIERTKSGIFIHQTNYVRKLLKKFHMHDSKPAKTPLTVRILHPENDIYGPKRKHEAILPHTFPYLAAIGSLLYLANTTRPDISFAVSLLSRYSQEPTWRHWTGIKQILRYLKGTEDLGLHYRSIESKKQL